MLLFLFGKMIFAQIKLFERQVMNGKKLTTKKLFQISEK